MRKISFAALTALIVLTLGTFSFGQTSFSSYVTEAISLNFYQLLTPITAPTGEQTTAVNKFAADTDTKTPDENITAAAFTPGNIVVCRVGTGAAALTNAATAAFLDEYSTTGTLVQSIALPTAVSGTNQILTASGTATSECQVTNSSDGQYLVVTGYNAATGTAAVAGTATTTVPRVIGRINVGGVIDTSTTTTSFSGNNIRSATSDNGTNFWSVGGATGVVYSTLGSNGAGTLVSTTQTNNRVVKVFNGQLYDSTSSGTNTNKGVNTVGTGLPTTTGQAIVRLPGLTDTTNPSSYSYFFADLNAAVAGLDTLYVADDSAAASNGGIQKFSYDGTNWTARGIVATSSRGLTGRVSGTTVTLFATTSATLPVLVTLTDSTGSTGTITGTPTTVATSPTNTAFRGVALAPVTAGNTAPTFTSNASATFTQNVAGSFTVSASGTPTPTITLTSGTLPNGVTFTDNGNGTATLAGTPTQSGTFSLVFTASNGTAPDATQNFTLTVNAAANPTVNLSIAPTTGSEAAQTQYTATVTASAAVTGDQTVNFALTGGTASTADFTTIAGTITIPSGATTGTTTFSVVDDTAVEGTENGTFTISNPSAGITLGATTTASVSITDNDVAAASDLTITQNAATAVAVGGTLNYTVVFSNNGAAVTTPFAVSFVLPASGYSNPTVVSTTGCSPNNTTAGNTITFTGCTLGANASQTITIAVTPTTTGTLTSGTATVDVNNSITETDETNNAAAGVATTVNAAPTSVVVNEVYGGGGNANAPYNSDYIELYNNGTTTVGIGGYSLQYASATGSFNSVIVLPGDTIPAGGFYLVQTRPAQAVGAALTPNFTSPNNIDLSAINGNVLLAAGTTTVGACPAAGAANVIDRVGYGTGTCFEGTAAAPAGSNTTSVQRGPNGADTNNNSADFAAMAGTPSATNLGPTAAAAQISGRVRTADGRGIQNARLMISGNGLRQPVYVTTGAFGYYKFNDLPAGETYVVSVTAKRYIFNNAAQVVSLTADLTAADFTANK